MISTQNQAKHFCFAIDTFNESALSNDCMSVIWTWLSNLFDIYSTFQSFSLIAFAIAEYHEGNLTLNLMTVMNCLIRM